MEASVSKLSPEKLESPEKKGITIKGDGDRIQKRSHNSDLEDIAINSMIDQLLNMSAQEGSPAKKEKAGTKLKIPSIGSRSKFFPRVEAEPFKPKTLSNEYHPMTGPNDEKVNKLLEETGYSLTVTPHQRLYGGPPPDWEGPAPGPGCQVFIGRIPKQLFEDSLVPLFEGCGTIFSMRLMMEGATSLSRGYGFVVYTSPEEAKNAERKLDEFEVLKGRPLKVVVSEPFCRLFLGNIPKLKSRNEILNFLSSTLEGVVEVITYTSPDEPTKNRGFCFVDFDTHAHASNAKKKFTCGSLNIFGCRVLADWADPQQEPDYSTMAGVKVVYVRGLTREVTEQDIFTVFNDYGTLEKVKKLKDYAFVHFQERKDALKAISELDGSLIRSAKLEVTLAKPPIDRQAREDILKARERRLLSNTQVKTTHHFKQLALDYNSGLKILDGKVIICGPKVTVLVKDP